MASRSRARGSHAAPSARRAGLERRHPRLRSRREGRRRRVPAGRSAQHDRAASQPRPGAGPSRGRTSRPRPPTSSTGDFDGDGRPDLIWTEYAYEGGAPGRPEVALGTSGPQLVRSWRATAPPTRGSWCLVISTPTEKDDRRPSHKSGYALDHFPIFVHPRCCWDALRDRDVRSYHLTGFAKSATIFDLDQDGVEDVVVEGGAVGTVDIHPIAGSAVSAHARSRNCSRSPTRASFRSRSRASSRRTWNSTTSISCARSSCSRAVRLPSTFCATRRGTHRGAPARAESSRRSRPEWRRRNPKTDRGVSRTLFVTATPCDSKGSRSCDCEASIPMPQPLTGTRLSDRPSTASRLCNAP